MEVTTVAGSYEAPGHADGLGTAARFNTPWDIVCDKRGNAFFSDSGNHRICKRAPDGTITTFAGGGGAGFSDGQGAAAKFNQPAGLAYDADDNLLVADSGNNRIRRITPGGLVTTVAGSSGAHSHKDGPAAHARFDCPWDVAVRPSGSILVADTGNHCIRVIHADPGTDNASVYTLAGQPGEEGFADGNSGAARFNYPVAVASDGEGNAYVADSDNHCIRKVSLAGAVSTVAGSGDAGNADGVGDQASFNDPGGLALDGDGNLVVADHKNHRLRMISPDRAVTTLAGSTQGHNDGQGGAAKFDEPMGIAFDASGDLLVTEYGGETIRKVAAGLTPPARLTPATPMAAAVPQFTANLAKLLDQDDDDNFYDVVFFVQGETIRAHKAILSAQCEYFATMFSSGFTEGSGTVETPLPVADTTPDAFRALLAYLYTDTMAFEEASVVDLACLAQRYIVTSLEGPIQEYCTNHVSPGNAIKWLVAADTHMLEGLRAMLLDRAISLYEEIEEEAPDTLNLLDKKLMRELLRSAITSPPAKRLKAGT